MVFPPGPKPFHVIATCVKGSFFIRFFHQSHNTVNIFCEEGGGGGLFALRQWISSSQKHGTYNP